MEGITDHNISPGVHELLREASLEDEGDEVNGEAVCGLRKVNRIPHPMFSPPDLVHEGPLIKGNILRDLLEDIEEKEVERIKGRLAPIIQQGNNPAFPL